MLRSPSIPFPTAARSYWLRVAAILSLVLLVSPTASMVLAQQLPSRPDAASQDVPQEALEAYHGPDLEGKDGPLSKANLELLALYYRYERAKEEGTTDTIGDDAEVRVSGEAVVVDAIARQEQTTQLRKKLLSLGLKNAASQGRIVSGLLPIEAIPAAARLEALQSLRPSLAQTQGGPSTPSLQESRDSSQIAPDTSQTTQRQGGTSGRSVWWYGGAVLLGLGAAFVLARLFRS